MRRPRSGSRFGSLKWNRVRRTVQSDIFIFYNAIPAEGSAASCRTPRARRQNDGVQGVSEVRQRPEVRANGPWRQIYEQERNKGLKMERKRSEDQVKPCQSKKSSDKTSRGSVADPRGQQPPLGGPSAPPARPRFPPGDQHTELLRRLGSEHAFSALSGPVVCLRPPFPFSTPFWWGRPAPS
ncbi:unnamed protein product [Lota lota]